jgi:hypothetical protein
MDLTESQRAHCVVWYAKSSSFADVQRKFRTLFGRNAVAPSRQNIRNWFQKFLKTGSVNRKKRSNVNFVREELLVEDVIQAFRADPHMSIRRLANLEGMPSATTIHRILRKAHFHPYKIQLIHQLRPQDLQKRLQFAQNMLALIEGDPYFINLLLFSDEAHFHVHGLVNKQDFRYWSQDNPGWFQEQPLHSQRITVWAAIGRQGVVGPFFFEENVNGANYLNLLQQCFIPVVQHWASFNQMIFQQDGAPPHWSLAVRNYLTATFPARWMGRASPNYPWPPYSPDLTPMDFFLWGFIKSRVYSTPIADKTELRLRIIQSFNDLPADLVSRSIASFERRLHLCIKRKGGSVEKCCS